jgi:glycosyltransferase involved in cell wall biosynthesis
MTDPFAAGRAQLHVDVSTLLERQWTGIPIVAAGLAGAILARLPGHVRFFLGPSLVDTALVADGLARNTGLFLAREIDAGHGLVGRLPVLERGAGAPVSVGLFPSVKPVRNLFDVECSILHDLSTLVLPYFHIKGNVDHHMATLLADIASNDVTVAVSEASMSDLQAYLGVDPARLMVVPNGVAWPDGFATEAANALSPLGAEPYLLILGTREPRKNILLVFEMLSRAPDLLATHKFVFVGKMGWLQEQHALPPNLEPALREGRILFTGFVGDATKYRLLAGAEATLYPSLFEGFGLPVLESLSAGTPCVASWSSSIPEVGGTLCSYFDPFSATDMHRALLALLARRRAEGAAFSAACKAHAATFTWAAAADRILTRLAGLVAQKARGSAPGPR